MTFTSRLLGLRADQPVAGAKPAPAPQAASLNVGYAAPGSPMMARWDANQAITQGYYGYMYVYRCARTIATTIAGLPFRAGLNPSSPGEYNPRSNLGFLLGPPPGGPAPGISPRQLWTWSIVSYLITGRFGWETVCPPGSKQPAALWPLAAQSLRPVPTEGGAKFFSGFEYWANATRRDLTPDQVFYAWRPSQDDWRQPESVLQAAAVPVSLGVAMDRYLASFMRNNMTGAKMVVTPGFDDASMRRSFQDQFLSEMTGYDNAGNTAFAEWEDDTSSGKIPSIQVVDLATKPVDSQMIEMLKWVRDTVCDALGVPMSIVGQASERTYENADQEHRNYWTGTILGLVEELLDSVNMNLAPRLGDEVGWFDLSQVAALKPANKFTQSDPVALVQAEIVDASEVREDIGLASEKPSAGSPVPVEPLPAIDDTPGVSPGSSGAARSASGSEPVDPATVLAYLADNYPQSVLGWVKDAQWVRDRSVLLERVKMARRPGGRDLAKVDGIAAAIKAGKHMDPVVLVDTGEDLYEIADGYHRTLATDRAGHDTIDAYVGSGVGRHGPWEQEMHDAKLNKSDAEKAKEAAGARAGTCTGDGPCDTHPFGEGHNWVTKVGGLPDYIRAVAHAFRRKGMSESESIERAVGVVRNWAHGEGPVTAATQARAAKAIAEWDAKKAAAHSTRDGLGGGLVTEASSAGSLLPAGSPPKVIARMAHLPTRSSRRGFCGRCGQKVSAKIHRVPRPSMSGARHRGPDGHEHVRTGHSTYARRLTAQQVDQKASSMEPAFAETMRQMFAAQRKATLDRLTGNRGRQAMKAATRAAGDEQPPRRAPLMDAAQIYDLTHWTAKTREALRPVYAAIGGLAEQQMSRFGATPDAKQAVIDALEQRSTHLAATVSATTLAQIQETLARGVTEGQSIGEMTAAVNRVFDEADRTRAELIARTETIGALNAAADAHAEGLGPDVVAGKEWIATVDPRTRPAHAAADRQIRAMGAPFTVGGFPMQHPGDPTAPPDQVCNCRCTTGYLTPAEYAKRTGSSIPATTPMAA